LLFLAGFNNLESDSNSDDSEARHSFIERIDLENYETVFDGDESRVNIYDQFVTLLDDLSRTDPNYYQSLIMSVPADKRQEFEDLLLLCGREQQHFRSRQVQQLGGIEFDRMDVPGEFRFT
jgi:hypothetical protein